MSNAQSADIKNCMFQFADGGFTTKGWTSTNYTPYEDTGLITLEEAEALWEEHLPKFKSLYEDSHMPGMSIWTNCKHETDYNTELRAIDDGMELEFENGETFEVKTTKEKTLV